MTNECANCGHEIAADTAGSACPVCGHLHGRAGSHEYTIDDQRQPAWRAYIKPLAVLAVVVIVLLLLRSCFMSRERPWDHPVDTPPPAPAAKEVARTNGTPGAKAVVSTAAEPSRIGHEFNLAQMFGRRYHQVWMSLGDSAVQEPGQQVVAFQEIARDWNELSFSNTCLEQVRPVFSELLAGSSDAAAMVTGTGPVDGRIASGMVLKSIADARTFAVATLRCIAADPTLSSSIGTLSVMAASVAAPESELSLFRGMGERWQAEIRTIKALPPPLDSERLSEPLLRLRLMDREWQKIRFMDPCLSGMKPLLSRGLGATASAVSALGLEAPGAAARFSYAQEQMASILGGIEGCAAGTPG